MVILLILLITQKDGLPQMPYHLGVHTDTGKDTLMVGVEGSLIFGVDSAGSEAVAAFTWALELDFSYKNVIGPLYDTGGNENVTFVRPPSFWAKALRKKPWVRRTDTVVVGTLYFDAPHWQETGEQWRITFIPTDTGLITIDTAWSPPANTLGAFDANALDYPASWGAKTVTIVSYCLTGDVNADSVITAADIIYIINFIFKGGPEPKPCTVIGDVNCSGTMTAADAIGIVTYVFKGGARPCYSCGLVEKGIWTCP